MIYPKELKDKVVARMMPPENIPVAELAKEHGVPEATLYNWRKKALEGGVAAPGDGRRPEDWSSSAKFAVVLETAAMSAAELGEYCRAKGLYPEQVAAWRKVCEAAHAPAEGTALAEERRANRRRIRELERDLLKKDRALAETAALLVLRKKAAAIWGEEKGA